MRSCPSFCLLRCGFGAGVGLICRVSRSLISSYKDLKEYTRRPLLKIIFDSGCVLSDFNTSLYVNPCFVSEKMYTKETIVQLLFFNYGSPLLSIDRHLQGHSTLGFLFSACIQFGLLHHRTLLGPCPRPLVRAGT